VKFTPPGGSIKVEQSETSGHVAVRITDTGKGIAQDFLPFVFDRFVQEDRSKKKMQNGLGLGLAIVRHLVEMHGGAVTAASDGEDRGATFTVTLPLAVLSEAPPAREPKTPAAQHAEPPLEMLALHGVRVLVVDDDPDTRELVRVVLTECGADVRIAAAAAEGWALLRQWNPDVIVSDVGMPEQDGYTFIEKVRADGIRAPAAALTAYARSGDRVRALSAGFQAHLAKPAEPAELVALVASLAGRTRREPPSRA
jgi:CheY-like chemotaxis protein